MVGDQRHEGKASFRRRSSLFNFSFLLRVLLLCLSLFFLSNVRNFIDQKRTSWKTSKPNIHMYKTKLAGTGSQQEQKN